MRRPFGDPADQEVPVVLWQQSSHPGASTALSLPLGHSVHHLQWFGSTPASAILSLKQRHAPFPPPAQIIHFFYPSKAQVLQVRSVEPVLHTAYLNPVWSLRATVYTHTQD